MVQKKINAKCLTCGLRQEVSGDVIDGHPIRLRLTDYTTQTCSCTKCKSGDLIEIKEATVKNNSGRPIQPESGKTDANKVDDTKTVRTGKSKSD